MIVVFAFLLFCLMVSVAWIGSKRFASVRGDVERVSLHETLDGLRGICAAAVFVHHSAMAFGYYSAGRWQPIRDLPEIAGNFMAHLGTVGVMLFFMITGFLFVDRLLRRGGVEDWPRFYKHRVRRIAPLYLLVVSVALLIGTTFTMYSGGRVMPGDVMSWLAFGFLPLQDIGAYNASWILVCGVLWTLAIEWEFYALLPVISVVCCSRKAATVGLAVASLATLALEFYDVIGLKSAVVILCFCFGAFAALIHGSRVSAQLKRWIYVPLLAIAFLLSVRYHFSSYNLYSLVAVGAAFLCISSGNSILGLLNLKPIKVLGVVSYSLYLGHGLVLFATSSMTQYGYHVYAITAALALVPVCLITYAYVERPFLSAKRSARTANTAYTSSEPPNPA